MNGGRHSGLATRLVVCNNADCPFDALLISKGERTMVKSTGTRYGSIAQFFHWCTAILVLVAFVYGPGGPEQRVYSSVHEFDRRLHETLGLCVFTLAVIRLLLRTIDARPGAPPVLRWMRVMATAVQRLLYMLLLALPLTAVAGAWLEGRPLTLVAGVEIPPLLGDFRAGRLASIAPYHSPGNWVLTTLACEGNAGSRRLQLCLARHRCRF